MRQLTCTAMLGVIILLSGSFKIPSPVAGGEFQLSAPLAVLICAYFGFKRYLIAGIIASALGLMLGTANIFNIMIAMVFRIVAGGLVTLAGTSLPVIAISGPLGTLSARLVMGQVLHVDWLVLAAAALPGMIFTAVAAAFLYKPGLALLGRIPSVRSQMIKQRSEVHHESVQH